MEKFKEYLNRLINFLIQLRDWLNGLPPIGKFTMRCVGYGGAGYTGQWWIPWAYDIVKSWF